MTVVPEEGEDDSQTKRSTYIWMIVQMVQKHLAHPLQCIRYGKKSGVTEIPIFYEKEGAEDEYFDTCDSPTDVFLTLFEKEIRDNIVYQTNLYGTQKGKSIILTENELLGFLGSNMLMGYHELPSWRSYWNLDSDLNVKMVSEVMSRNRFATLIPNLHINDNDFIENNKSDKVYKIWPLVASLNSMFQKHYQPQRNVSIDESIILFKGVGTP